MSATQDNHVVIGIVADPFNYPAEESIERQINLSASKCPDCTNFRIVSDPLMKLTENREQTTEISHKFDKGYNVVVAIVGVPGNSNYQQEIHGLLDAWKNAPDKPALLIVSNHPELTRKTVESWDEWEHLPDELKSAIRVNDEYLVISGPKMLDTLKERVDASRELHDALVATRPQGMDTEVARPLFARSSTLAFPRIVKIGGVC